MARGRKRKGLGDTIERITEVTGIKSVVKSIAGEDCGCQERKEWLNKAFPYVNTQEKCMNEEQMEYYAHFKETYYSKISESVRVPAEEVKKIISLYNSVFKVNVKGCETCNLKTYIDRIDQVYIKLQENGQT